MPMNESSCITTIENELTSKGFKLDEAPRTKEMISIIVNAVISEVRKGTVSTTVTGTSASGGPVTGTGTGAIN